MLTESSQLLKLWSLLGQAPRLAEEYLKKLPRKLCVGY